MKNIDDTKQQSSPKQDGQWQNDQKQNSQKQNYQKQLEDILNRQTGRKRLLLHSCCAPCSSYVLEYLSEYFDIWAYYDNPNITEQEEYLKRAAELNRLAECMNKEHQWTIRVVEGQYDPKRFFEAVRGLEQCPEGGDRCKKCFELRLADSAAYAAQHGFDYYTTSLTISPLKNASLLNEIGEQMGKKYGVEFLPSDFKKKNGYQRSIELSKEYGLYRQDYCGCIFSKRDRMSRQE
ncbi:MAG: epoxyqueuosine reductase QueH [Lachnospiraceae bacterium]